MIIKKWIREWSRQGEFNSFNSWKGLLYADWYKAIKKGEFLPPIEASLDPIHDCNLMCEHCNANKYLVDKKSEKQRMPDEHLLNLIRFLGEWGVKAICFGGGGEPTLHDRLADAIVLTNQSGMDSSVATNGVLFHDQLIQAMVSSCKWIGVSVDAASSETYTYGRRQELYERVLNNIERLVGAIEREKTICDVAYKFLIFSYNQHEIYQACKIAKELGVGTFHARPADFRHQGMGKLKKEEFTYSIDTIKEQFAKCHELEDDTFKVFTIMHKFDDVFQPRKDFSQCYAAPLCIQLCADGKIYLCPDQRHVEYYELGSHYPDPENIAKVWGNKKHLRLVFETGKESCDSRCTFTPYNRQCEQLFIQDHDPMCKWFV